MGGSVVGLDIGTSAVRAAQVAGGRKGGSLLSFGQVALAPGAVVDGEIRDPGAVSEAVAQLWKRAKIKSKNVVIGVANQRVVVRPVDLPFLEEKEFRSALRFQASDHIPMPVDDAELDFQMIGEYTTDNHEHMMRVLLVAAASDMVHSFISAAGGANVKVVAVDLKPFAITRAVSAAARQEVGVAGAEAVVDVGAGVTNIVVHHNGEPRFVRILLVGGDDATRALADEFGIEPEAAEATKIDIGRGVGSADALRVLDAGVGRLVEEIRGSLDYYLSQDDSEPLASLILTGGGSLTPGLASKLEQTLRVPVRGGQALTGLNTSKSGLTPAQIAQIEPVAAAAVGLAMGVSAR